MDSGYAEQQLLLDQMEYRINKIYAQAEKELDEKIKKYYKDFKRLDEKKLKEVDDGKLSMEHYREWRKQKVMSGKIWEQKKEAIAKDLYNANDLAYSVIYEYMPDLYASGHNFGTYEIEKGAHIDTSYTLYDHDAVERLLAENPDLLPKPKLSKIKDMKWNRQSIQGVMLQGLLQGDSIPHLAKRLSTVTGERNRKACIRNARTMATSAHNGGKLNAFKRAEAMGVELVQEWKAVFDGRTRDTHRLLDGEKRKVGEVFSNGCRFPADPQGLPREVYNCRCRLKGIPKGLEPRAEKYRIPGKDIEGLSYEEWKKGHNATHMKPKAQPKHKIEKKTDNLYSVKIADILGVDNDNIKITALPKEVQKNVLRAVEKSVLKCPQLKGWLKEIEFSNEVKEPALAQSYSFSGKIRLGSHFLDADGLKRELQFNSDIQHMIQGANIESVVMHEIGHQIDALMTTKGIANATISQYGMIRTSHEVQREVLNELGFFDYIMESRKDLAERYRGRELNEMVLADRQMWIREHISEYASENNNEFWAELFAEYMSAEKPREAAQVFGNIFEKLLKEL